MIRIFVALLQLLSPFQGLHFLYPLVFHPVMFLLAFDWLMQFSLVRRDLKSIPSFWGDWGSGDNDTIQDLKDDIMENGLQTPLQLHVGRDDGRVILGEGNHRIIARVTNEKLIGTN